MQATYVTMMLETNEYTQVLQGLYNKSLILEDISLFHPVLGFYHLDALARVDYSISVLAYNTSSPKVLLSHDAIRRRLAEAKVGLYARYPQFMAWLETTHPHVYEVFPLFIQNIYSKEHPASYRSFRIVLDPDSKIPMPARYFRIMIEEMFDPQYLNMIYKGSKAAKLFDEYANMQ
jgi:hypothetical protein